ncbi:MAG: DUF4145 domain-containing protein [Bacteroidales bacterium]|nr:DUF4145 domain-containing protein [Bacteroidales bacterium]
MNYILGVQLPLNRCPHCNVDSPNLKSMVAFETISFIGIRWNWRVFFCARCGGVVLAAAKEGKTEIVEMYPNQIIISETIPSRAKEYLEQAIESIHAPSGAIMLAASSVDSMLKNKGYNKGSLFDRINLATKDHLITEGMAKWAHQVRLDANEQRHADDNFIMPTENEAKKVIEFTLALAEFLFVLPSRVNKGIEDSKHN